MFLCFVSWLFHVTVLLNLIFNGCSSSVLSWIDRVTTETKFSIICFANVPVPGESEFVHQVNIRLFRN